jgi:hypothetical protein
MKGMVMKNKKYTISTKQLYELDKLIKQTIKDTAYDNKTRSSDDFNHIYDQYFNLRVWIKNNLKEA